MTRDQNATEPSDDRVGDRVDDGDNDGGNATRTLPRKRRRAEKTAETLSRLIHAAAEVIGEVGYGNATIARITMRAGLALGTFYGYFDSRQEMFDQILPLVGEDMIDFIRERTAPGSSTIERERLGIRAFFEFMVENPGFYRLLNEAETMAPKAHQAHFQNISSRYLKALRHGVTQGEIIGYEERELEVLVYILMSARSYMVMRYGVAGQGMKMPPDWVIDTYVKFIHGGLQHSTRIETSASKVDCQAG
jgi:AcrR family transcriptional regulator